MNPRPTVEPCDVDQDGCVEIKNLGGQCVLMSDEAFREMLGVGVGCDEVDRDSDPDCQHTCRECVASRRRGSCGQSRRIKRGH
jgi:hypothetical protein